MSDTAIDLAAVEATRAAIRERYLRPAGERPPSSARGVHHIALLSSDVERTVRFYQELLEFPLTEIFENRDYQGSNHFFFDIGHGNLLAFFDFPGAPAGRSGAGAMHHVAFSVDGVDELRRLAQELEEKGVAVSPVVDHDFIKSIYFRDPDGILLEAAAYTRALGEADVLADPDPVPALRDLMRR